MVSFFGDYDTSETVVIPFNTFSSDDPSASVTITNLLATDIYVHKDGDVAEGSPGGITVDIDVSTPTGNHWAKLDLSNTDDPDFYANGSRYQVRMEGTTVDAGTVNAWIGAFSIGCTLRPTAPGRTLDVSAGGEAGIDWANIGSPTTAVDLSGTDIQKVDTCTTNEDMVGTDGALTDKAGFSLAATGADLILKTSTFALAIADAVWDELLVGHVTPDSAGLVLNEWQDGGRLDLILDAVAEDTATTLPTQISGLNNISTSDLDTALTDIHLDHLFHADYDPASPPGTATALLNELIESDGGVSRFTANALAQAPTGGSAPTAAAIADAVWDEGQSGHTSANSFGALQYIAHTALPTNWATDVTANSALDYLACDGATAYDRTTDSLQEIRDRGDSSWVTGAGGSDRLLLVDTTISGGPASQTEFNITAGSTDDDAYNGCTIVFEDASTPTQKAACVVDDYVGATKTVHLLEAPAFTIADTDKVYILAERSVKPTAVANYHVDINATGEVGLDLDNTSGTISAAQLGADCITSAKIADDAISSEHLNTGCLTADAFATDALAAATFATGCFTADAFAVNALVAATFAASSLDGKGDWNTVVPDAAGVAPTAVEIRTEIDSNSTQLAAILTDTGTTLPATLTTIDGIVDDILVDTGTTLPATLSAIESKIDTVDGIVDDILVDTAQIGVAGAGLSAIPWNSSWDAEVQSECNDAIEANNLDHLCKTATAAADMTVEVVDNSILSRILANGDTSNFDPSTDGLQLIRDRGDSSWVTGVGGSDRLLMVDTTIATLASQVSFTLTAGSTDDDAYNGCTIVIEDATTSTQKAVGIVDDYTGASKTITLLEDPGVYTMATTDKVYILAEKTLKPTTAANYHVDVSPDGNVGIDWANVANPTTAVDLSATDIQLCDTTTAVTALTAAHTEPTGVPAANESPLDKLGFVFMTLRNKIVRDGSDITIYDDGGAAEWKKAYTDVAGTYTETEAESP